MTGPVKSDCQRYCEARTGLLDECGEPCGPDEDWCARHRSGHEPIGGVVTCPDCTGHGCRRCARKGEVLAESTDGGRTFRPIDDCDGGDDA